MKRSYFLASIIGLVFSLTAVLTWAEVSDGILEGSEWAMYNWQIPAWNQEVTASLRSLQYQAVLLKACHILLEYGWWFLAIPSMVGCLVVKLAEWAEKFPTAWCLLFALKLTASIVGPVSLLMGVGLAAYAHTGFLLDHLFICWLAFLFFVFLACASGLAPLIFILAFAYAPVGRSGIGTTENAIVV